METMKNVAELLKSKARGKAWAEEALPVLVDVALQTKKMKADKEEEAGASKVILAGITEKYKGALAALEAMSENIRERVLKEYEGTEAIEGEEGTLSFPQRWGFEVTDVKKVEAKFLMVDPVAVNLEIKNGVRKIKGLEIGQVRRLQVSTKGSE